MRNFYLIFIVIFFTSCSISIPPLTQNNRDEIGSKEILIFLDGTTNTPKDDTNIFKLYKLKQCKENISSFYTVGVGGGVDQRFLGMGFGTGIGKDVRDAYKYICKNYDKKRNDKLHFFGFSRGGYASLILSNLIYVTGIVDLSKIEEENEKDKLIAKLYRAYRGKNDVEKRKSDIKKVIKKVEKKLKIEIKIQDNVFIETLNLFDVVEALSTPDYNDEKFCTPNKNHLAQLINVKKVLHAVSLDDNRSRIFTPILQTCDEIQTSELGEIKRSVNDFVTEVWFAGAHSDIGGGYHDNLSNVTLNWMLEELKDKNLFTKYSFNEHDNYGKIHDGEESLKFFYRRRDRNIKRFLNLNYNGGKLNLHYSVIKRLEEGIYHKHKLSNKENKFWFDRKNLEDCFVKKNDSVRIFNEDCKYFKVISKKENKKDLIR